ncbi:putative inactive purple acid phosphatase 16 [Acorus calamus]|uniref:Inactive purple acid phosphatase 16 n=1 Tax=Acorus calamus TaxID=4465 RepID=A0AAV9EXL2_ACOCL|nr:putative inactive purple acid phosphatase 16 [Acorus calamus]
MPSLLSICFTALLFLQINGHYSSTHDALNGDQRLHVSSVGSFKIALFADLHYGENAWTDWGPVQDVNSDRVMSTDLDIEKPDFVVYLGDVITANNLPIQNASLYWDKATSPTRERGLPFSTVFGNHDDAPFEWPSDWFSPSGLPEIRCPPDILRRDGGCVFRGTIRTQLMVGEINRDPLSRSRAGPSGLWPSVSNYVLRVESMGRRAGSVVAFLYFLDSGGGTYPR